LTLRGHLAEVSVLLKHNFPRRTGPGSYQADKRVVRVFGDEPAKRSIPHPVAHRGFVGRQGALLRRLRPSSPRVRCEELSRFPGVA
jgi:hypothetical protein